MCDTCNEVDTENKTLDNILLNGNTGKIHVHGFDHGYILKNNCNGTKKKLF